MPVPRKFVLSVIALGLVATPGFTADNQVIKSNNDDRNYQNLVLDNGLRVLLVSDPDTDKAAAAMDIDAGSSAEPNDRPGLAHFLEHMLFLGTEKYPESDAYHSFLSGHGGSHNAYTGYENTNYFFDVDADHLRSALDRFGQFFVAPLMNPEYVERERSIVDSEFQMLRQREGWRIRAATQQVVNPEHPFSRFSVGNNESLADRPNDSVREDLLTFYENHYSADNMALVVYGQETLPVLQQWVEEIFAAVPDRAVADDAVSLPLFTAETLPLRLAVEPVQETKQLLLTFPIPAVEEHYREAPTRYLGNLLGHEGAGSLLSLLKERNWVDGLSAGLGMSTPEEATFNVSVSLTEAGIEQVETIADLVFDYLALIRDGGIEEWRFQEESRLAALDFRFQEPSPPIRYASRLARSQQVYPTADIIRGPYAMDRYDPELIQRYLDRLTPDNVLMTVVAPGVETDQRSPWFETLYSTQPLDGQTLADWQQIGDDSDALAALSLPVANPFVPENLTLEELQSPTENPVVIAEAPGYVLWHQQDSEFRVPRADFFFSVRSPLANRSPRDTVLTELYVNAVREELNEFAYPAMLAGLDYSIYRHVRGFSVRIAGYADKQSELLARILDTLESLSIDEALFVRLKQDLQRELRNVARSDPHGQARGEIYDLLLRPSWDEEEQLTALDDLQVADLNTHRDALLAALEVVALAHGNILPETAEVLGQQLQTVLLVDAKAMDVPRAEVLKLTGEVPYRRRLEVDQDNSAIAYYFQGDGQTPAEQARYLLLGQMIHQPFFSELRTQEQLGYVVYASYMPILEIPGTVFGVQSATTAPDVLREHIETFLQDFAASLDEMSDEDFDRQRVSALSDLLEKDTQLTERSERYWREIDRENPDFDSREKLAAALESMERADFIRFYRESLLGDQPQRLVVYAVGKPHLTEVASDISTLIENLQRFKQDREAFPG